MAGKNKPNPKNLERRRKNFDEGGLSSQRGYKRPGSNKK